MKEYPRQEDGYDVDDILKHSWGYDQTNIDFFRIVRRSASTLWLRPMTVRSMGEVGFMAEKVVPGEDVEDARVIRRKLHRRDGEPIGCAIRESYGWASAWSGNPATATHYA